MEKHLRNLGSLHLKRLGMIDDRYRLRRKSGRVCRARSFSIDDRMLQETRCEIVKAALNWYHSWDEEKEAWQNEDDLADAIRSYKWVKGEPI